MASIRENLDKRGPASSNPEKRDVCVNEKAVPLLRICVPTALLSGCGKTRLNPSSSPLFRHFYRLLINFMLA